MNNNPVEEERGNPAYEALAAEIEAVRQEQRTFVREEQFRTEMDSLQSAVTSLSGEISNRDNKKALSGIERDLQTIDKRIRAVEAKAKTAPLRSYSFKPYERAAGAATKAGGSVKVFGIDRTVRDIPLKGDPLFPQVNHITVSMPFQDPKCCGKHEPVVRIGLSSYPRSFVPFSSVYGPPGHRVEFTAIEIDGYRGDYAIGAMSDYGAHYVSGVVNIELDEGVYFVIRLGFEVDPAKPLTLEQANDALHAFLDAISLRRS